MQLSRRGELGAYCTWSAPRICGIWIEATMRIVHRTELPAIQSTPLHHKHSGRNKTKNAKHDI
jgi:hypothetical protein